MHSQMQSPEHSAWFVPLCRCILEHLGAQEDQQFLVHPKRSTKIDTSFVFVHSYCLSETLKEFMLEQCFTRHDRLQCVLKSLQWVRIADAKIFISRPIDRDNADVETRVSTLSWGNCARKTEIREKWLNQFHFYLQEGLEDLKIQVFLGLPNDIKPEKQYYEY